MPASLAIASSKWNHQTPGRASTASGGGQVFAHSDGELMRMVVKLDQLEIGDGLTMAFINTVFGEGLEIVGFQRVSDIIALFHVVYRGIFQTLTKDARENPEKFDVHHDWLFPRD